MLYVSNEFGTASHLCACGCGAKIRTPLGPTEWSIKDEPAGPSLWPSIGNWQRPCKSHYVISKGKVVWAPRWSDDQILAGRANEQLRREAYFSQLRSKRNNRWSRFVEWLKSKFI
ncbi:DUF6527 family protein [Herbaspirillum rubrisubalbicans]|uniref:DUF6527 family protein n=1 Tax=Herbaspirillum rubrisubalbicans TaxID=80842 RepID=UPI0035A25AA5